MRVSSMPMRGEISLPPLGRGAKIPSIFDRRSTASLVRNREFVAVCGFCLIGLLMWLIVAMQLSFTDEMAALLTQV